ncbi:MAG: TlpA disulfide reductase family protein [Capnocytophaga sp.]|nr:TlpA disulfide reductase family protein [Capnocytophaga sp.]
MKKNIFLLLFILLGQGINAQIVMSERLQYSQAASPDNKQLFFIDYWATWCAPCINVAKYLNVLQEKYAKQLYIVSLTEENPDVVRKFLQKHTTKLAVSLDYDGQNFKNNKVKSLPYGMLLNADGKVLWKGNPSDLKDYQIDKFLKQNTKSVPIQSFLQYKSYEIENVEEIKIDGDFKITPITSSYAQTINIEQVSPELIGLRGSLKQILAFLKNVNTSQINISDKKNASYQLIFKQNTDREIIFSNLLKMLSLKLSESERKGETLQVTLTSYDKLWNDKQIDWGFPNSKIMIEAEQITADNLSLRDMLTLISQLRDIPILLKNNPMYVRTQPYDWQIHYMYDELFLNNLNDYGFRAEIRNDYYPVYSFD